MELNRNVLIPEIRRVNKAQVAEFFEVSIQTVDGWLRRGCPTLERGSSPGRPWTLDLLAVARWRYELAGGMTSDIDPDILPPKDRLDWYRGETEKRKLQVTDGQLIEATIHETQMAKVIKLCVNWAETFADVMERDAGLSPEQVERVQVAVDRQRDRLYNELITGVRHAES